MTLDELLAKHCFEREKGTPTLTQADVDKLAEVCEEQGHHPDVHIYNYRWVGLDFSTHSIGGLSENDFIMAAKVNQLAAGI